jgi:site-specific recombinase XerD
MWARAGRSLRPDSADKKDQYVHPPPPTRSTRRRGAVTADVVRLRGDTELAQAAQQAHAALTRYLDRCGLAANTVRAYRRQAAAYVGWLAAHAAHHPDAFTDTVGAEAAVTRWRRHLLRRKASPASVNQALAAVTMLYEHGPQLRIAVKRARVESPGEPDALTTAQQGAVERAADRRGRRDAAIIAVLLYTGARAEECTRLEVDDVAITPRTGQVRLLGKGDQVWVVPLPVRGRERISAWLTERGNRPGPLWLGQRGPLSVSGITQVVLAVGRQVGIGGLRPHRLRHTYATRLRQGGADVAQVQALLGHASVETAGRYFRAGAAEQANVVERVFE